MLGPWVLVGVFARVFIESGCLFPFLPGDSLLFTAAMLHKQLGFSVPTLLILAIVAAFLGDQVGYFLGERYGRRLFRDDARILKTEYLGQAEAFFDRHGVKSIVLARFVPIVRTYVPLTAGTSLMRYARFIRWNALGAILWVGSMTILGLTLGSVQVVADNLDIMVTLIIVISVAPMIVSGIVKYRKSRRAKTRTQ